MSTRIAASRYAASVAPAAPSGSTWLPSDWSSARPFALCLAAAVLVFLARIHEVLPPLGKLYPAKLIALPLVATAIIGLRRDLFKRALQLTPVRCVLIIAALAVLSVPGSVYPRQSVMFLTGPFFRFLILFVLVAAGFGDRRIFKTCIIALVIGVTLAAARALLGWNGGWDEGRFAIGGTYDPNASASLFVLTIPFALIQGWIFRRTTSLTYVVAVHLLFDLFVFMVLVHAHDPSMFDIFITAPAGTSP